MRLQSHEEITRLRQRLCEMTESGCQTTDGREILLTRYTHPEPELQLLIDQLKLRLPPQPPPRITTAAGHQRRPP
jgi:hypothetical protein